jgi:hypothetical protein
MGDYPKTLFRFRSLNGKERFEQELDAITNRQQSSVALRESIDGWFSSLEGGLHGR